MKLSTDWEIKKLPEVWEILDKYREPINNKERTERIEGIKEDELFPYFGATKLLSYLEEKWGNLRKIHPLEQLMTDKTQLVYFQRVGKLFGYLSF